jgi:hypothetical protein
VYAVAQQNDHRDHGDRAADGAREPEPEHAVDQRLHYRFLLQLETRAELVLFALANGLIGAT